MARLKLKGDFVFLIKKKNHAGEKKFCRRKGQEYGFVPFLVIVLLLFFFGFSMWKNATKIAVERASFTQAEQLASIINILQSAPETTHAMFRTVQGKCRIEINQMYVLYESEGRQYKSDILQTGMKIKKINFECSENMRKTFCFVKTKSAINIFEPVNDCIRG